MKTTNKKRIIEITMRQHSTGFLRIIKLVHAIAVPVPKTESWPRKSDHAVVGDVIEHTQAKTLVDDPETYRVTVIE